MTSAEEFEAECEGLSAEAIRCLKECQTTNDVEGAHTDADDVLCDLLEHLGFADVVAEWEKVRKWYA